MSKITNEPDSLKEVLVQEVLIALLLPALKMAGRSELGCAASSKMENNIDLVRLEGKIDATLGESRERLLRMQVLHGVLDRERMLLRISAQEKELEKLKRDVQCRLQVSRFGVHRTSHSFDHYCTSCLPLRPWHV